MGELQTRVPQCFGAFQGQCSAPTDYDTLNMFQVAQNFLLIGNRTQGRNTREVETGTGKCPRTRSICQQEFVVFDEIAIVKLDCMLSGINLGYTRWHKAQSLLLVKVRGPRPELLLGQACAKEILQRGPVVRGKGIIRDNGNGARGIFRPQEFRRCYPGNTVADKVKQMPPVELVLADGSVYPQKGKVELVEGQFDKTVGAIKFRASFPNDQGMLRSGSTGKVRIPTLYKSVLVVPQDATFELQGKVFVYTVADSNKIVTKPLGISGRTTNYYVVSDGVKEGDKIVLSSMSTTLIGGLRDGMKITPQMVSTDSLLKVKPI